MRTFPLWLRGLLAAILLGSLAAGVTLDVWMRGHTPREVQAMRLSKAGDHERAEQLYWAALNAGPVTVPLVVAYLDAHAQSGAPVPKRTDRDEQSGIESFGHGKRARAVTLRDHAVDELLAREDLPPDVALLGNYWRDVRSGLVLADEQTDVEAAADATPPMPWANHLLARSAAAHDDLAGAVKRFEREGVAFGRADDVALVFAIYAQENDWETMGQKLADPAIARLAAPWVRFRYSVEVRDWPSAARFAWPAAYDRHSSLGSLLLAAISCLAWFAFCARLGRSTERARVRLPLYLLALPLGALSILPTDVLIAVQESVLHLEQTGDLARDALFYFFGVGFREELSKLLLFAPLVPLLRLAKATKLDVLVCGALVGLGFATVENLSYFANADLTTAMARFLTANFLHMSLTGLTAAALWEGARDPERQMFDASRTFLVVVAMHAAYDFFITAPGGASYLSMVVFLVLSRMFTSQIHEARGRARRGPSVLDVFTIGVTCLLGASFVYASALVGPGPAAAALLEGLIGLFIIAYFFVQELRRL